ncbi:MAG: RsmB/NOP family class I SAM-dependent RNA methyltransferase [Alkalispirochaetaceae bacterium]
MGRKKRHARGSPEARTGRLKGAEGFDRYFTELFEERWETLRGALGESSGYLTLREGLRREYYLDRASVIPARTLRVDETAKILDLCAAPGGKSLILALRMREDAVLTANDRSRQRLGRLRRVLEEHLPEAILERVEATGHDAALWGKMRPESVGAVLADVPCSSERHLLSSPPHLAQWSESRITRLGKQAVGILASGFDALEPGGSLVYSTCALSPEENDAVVERLLRRRGNACEIDPPGERELATICDGILPTSALERTRLGYQILPDRANGSGPIYFARLRKAGQL